MQKLLRVTQAARRADLHAGNEPFCNAQTGMGY
jgi:hypothetical protein